MTTLKPEVTRCGVFNMQVCVPKDWTDKQVKKYADRANVAGTRNGWQVCKTEDPLRVPCKERIDFVHIVLAC